ncbi:MAG: hypothetical protein V1676_03010 [Candidatus Diapherotrites archaeon]
MPKKHAKQAGQKKPTKLNIKMNAKNALIFVLVVVVIVAGYFALSGGNIGQALKPTAGTQNVFLQARGIADPARVVEFVKVFQIPAVRAAYARAAAPVPAEWGNHYGVCYRGYCYGWVEVKNAYLSSRGWTDADLADKAKLDIALAELTNGISAGLNSGTLRLCDGKGAYCQFCEDTDGGDRQYVAGKVTYSRKGQDKLLEKTDECQATGGLMEYYCRDYDWMFHNYSCTYGCENTANGGQCKKSGTGGSECTKHEDCVSKGMVCDLGTKKCVNCYDTDGGGDFTQAKVAGTVYVGKNTAAQTIPGKEYYAIDDFCDAYSGGMTGACPPPENKEPGQCLQDKCYGTCKKIVEQYCSAGKNASKYYACNEGQLYKDFVCRCDLAKQDGDNDTCAPSYCGLPYGG